MDRSYLMLEALHAQPPTPGLRHHNRAFYFDIGASTYTSGSGGPSQKYFVEVYKALGITFDRMFLWEAAHVDPVALFAELPKELFAAYQVSFCVTRQGRCASKVCCIAPHRLIGMI